MEELLAGLTAAQKEAVTATEGTIRVIAGAGSGKTNALTRRYAYLVTELGILPGNILCVTFTNKAANEMRRRIHALTGDNDTGYINTFHGFCVSVLHEDAYAVGYPKNFIVLDNSDINAMLSMIYEERGLTLRDMSFGDARDMIEIQKLFQKPDYYLDMIDDSPESLHALHEKYRNATNTKDIIFYGYLYQEKKCYALDYNDLILFSLYIFQEHEDIRLKWQQRLEYIMIDEFQDIDQLQYRLMCVLCGYHNNLFIVGDPDQTIYTWRGANVKYLLDFDKEFPCTKTILMMENFRSTPEILAVANSLIDRNRDRIKKSLLPMLPAGEEVACRHLKTQEDEAVWIAEEIERLHGEGNAYRDMAILYRSHHCSRSVEKALQDAKIPYTIYSGISFYDRAEIKDALSYLRMIAYQDDLSLLRIVNRPKRNLGQKRIRFLQDYAAEQGCTLYTALRINLEEDIFKGTKAAKFLDLIERYSALTEQRSVSELLGAILSESGYETLLRTEGSRERLDNLAELKQSIYDFETSCGEETTLDAYLSTVALYTAGDLSNSADKVKLMTVHAAKGLEFPTVFLCCMNEGIFPSGKVRTIESMEEERRLAFVATTRAEKRLFFTEAEGRNLDGSPRYPSRFLLDIDPALFRYENKPDDSILESQKANIAAAERYLPENMDTLLLSHGQRVRHSVFGTGTVLEADRDKAAHVIQFDDLSTPRALSFKAKLEKL